MHTLNHDAAIQAESAGQTTSAHCAKVSIARLVCSLNWLAAIYGRTRLLRRQSVVLPGFHEYVFSRASEVCEGSACSKRRSLKAVR